MTQILVIGDLIVDETILVDVDRTSPEAPVPIAALTKDEVYKTPGGAGFAAAFAANCKMDTSLITTASSDNSSLLWFNYNIETWSVNKESGYTFKNVTKTRIIDRKSGYHLLRLDNDRIADKPQVTPDDVIKVITKAYDPTKIDACLLSDYNKGFFSPEEEWDQLVRFLTENDILTLLDTKAKNIYHWTGSYKQLHDKLWLKVNKQEAEGLIDQHLSAQHSKAVPRDLVEQYIVTNLIVTLGPNGAEAYYAQAGAGPTTITCRPTTRSNTTPDVTGCGDIFDIVFISYLAENPGSLQQVVPNALQVAVDTASNYTYQPLKDKFKCQQ